MNNDEHLVSINDGEFLDQLSDYKFLKKDTTPWELHQQMY